MFSDIFQYSFTLHKGFPLARGPGDPTKHIQCSVVAIYVASSCMLLKFFTCLWESFQKQLQPKNNFETLRILEWVTVQYNAMSVCQYIFVHCI